jgi:hypothetical protein
MRATEAARGANRGSQRGSEAANGYRGADFFSDFLVSWCETDQL